MNEWWLAYNVEAVERWVNRLCGEVGYVGEKGEMG